VNVYTLNGQKIMSQNYFENPGDVRINIEKIPVGIYLMQVEGEKFSETIKIIKK